MPCGKKKCKRYVPYNIYGRRGRTILAKSKKEAIKKAPQNAEKVYSEAHLLNKFGSVPREIW